MLMTMLNGRSAALSKWDSSRVKSLDHIVIPLGDGGEQKFNGAYELSTCENPVIPMVLPGFFVFP